MQLIKPANFVGGNDLIKSAEVVNEADPVGRDTNGFIVVATNAAGAIVKPQGLAFFADNNGTGGARTGDGTTVRCCIVRQCKLLNANSTLVPGLGKGKPIYLAGVPTATTSGLTCTRPSTNTQATVNMGYVGSNGTTLEINVDPNADLEFQTAGNSTLVAA
jgi:hypothetical protein